MTREDHQQPNEWTYRSCGMFTAPADTPLSAKELHEWEHTILGLNQRVQEIYDACVAEAARKTGLSPRTIRSITDKLVASQRVTAAAVDALQRGSLLPTRIQAVRSVLSDYRKDVLIPVANAVGPTARSILSVLLPITRRLPSVLRRAWQDCDPRAWETRAWDPEL